jgi:hypothetical protein
MCNAALSCTSLSLIRREGAHEFWWHCIIVSSFCATHDIVIDLVRPQRTTNYGQAYIRLLLISVRKNI